MKAKTFRSVAGKTGTIHVEEEKTLIIKHKGESSEAIEIDLDKRLIRIYDNNSWTILPMNRDQRFDEKARLISHIDQFKTS